MTVERRVDVDLVDRFGAMKDDASWAALAPQLSHAMVNAAGRDDKDELLVASMLDVLGEENVYAALAAVADLPAVVGTVRLAGWYLDRLSEDAEFIRLVDQHRDGAGLHLPETPRDTEQALMRVAALGTHALEEGDLREAASAAVRVFDLVRAVREQTSRDDEVVQQWSELARGLRVPAAITELRRLEVDREGAEPWWHLAERPGFMLSASSGRSSETQIDLVHDGVRVARQTRSSGDVFIAIDDRRPQVHPGCVLHLEVGQDREPFLALLVEDAESGAALSELTAEARGELPQIWLSPHVTEHPAELGDVDLRLVPRSVAASTLRVKESWRAFAHAAEATPTLRAKVLEGLR